jgi:hypothetical protein
VVVAECIWLLNRSLQFSLQWFLGNKGHLPMTVWWGIPSRGFQRLYGTERSTSRMEFKCVFLEICAVAGFDLRPCR